MAALQRECVIQPEAQSGFLPLTKQWVLILTAQGSGSVGQRDSTLQHPFTVLWDAQGTGPATNCSLHKLQPQG